MTAGRNLDVGLHLMDHQVVDTDGRLVCKVDDLELTETEDGDLLVTAILVGPRVLGPRLGGRLGRWIAGAAQRLSTADRPEPPRIDFAQVTEIGTAITVARRVEELAVSPVDEWLGEHVIGRIPGERDAGQ